MSEDIILVRIPLTAEQYEHIKKGGAISWKTKYLEEEKE
jgi:hypothetical protein